MGMLCLIHCQFSRLGTWIPFVVLFVSYVSLRGDLVVITCVFLSLSCYTCDYYELCVYRLLCLVVQKSTKEECYPSDPFPVQ